MNLQMFAEVPYNFTYSVYADVSKMQNADSELVRHVMSDLVSQAVISIFINVFIDEIAGMISDSTFDYDLYTYLWRIAISLKKSCYT